MEQLLPLHGYDVDFCQWAIEQAQLLREHRFDLVDIENVAEEIESLSKHDRREVASRLVVLFMHLLKWQLQPSLQGSSWLSTIVTQRQAIERVLEDSPSLFALLRDTRRIQRIWRHAVERAELETSLTCFPASCPWDIEQQVLSNSWLP